MASVRSCDAPAPGRQLRRTVPPEQTTQIAHSDFYLRLSAAIVVSSMCAASHRNSCINGLRKVADLTEAYVVKAAIWPLYCSDALIGVILRVSCWNNNRWRQTEVEDLANGL